MIGKFLKVFTPAMFGYLAGNIHVKYQLKNYIDNPIKNPIYDDG